MIIDDDEVIAGALYQHLIKSGIAADLAINFAEADTLLVANDYAIVLMDAYLTGQLSHRAVEFVDHVRSRRPNSQILLLTAYGSPALFDRARGDKRITVVAKPQPVSYLSDLINGFLTAASSP